MSAILAWLWRRKLAVGLTVAVTWGVTATTVAVQKWKAEIATRAVANERLADFHVSNENAKTLDRAYRAVVTSTTPELARMASLRAHADSLEQEADAQARTASIRLTKAGDSLTATLDSAWSVVVKAQASETLIAPETLKPLILTAQRQHTRERAAQRGVSEALSRQLAATVKLRIAADSTIRLWQTRYTALEDAYEARVDACRECRETVEAMAAGQGSGWSTFHKATAGVALLAVGYAAGSGF